MSTPIFNHLDYSVNVDFFMGFIPLFAGFLHWAKKRFDDPKYDIGIKRVVLFDAPYNAEELDAEVRRQLYEQSIDKLYKLDLAIQNTGTETLNSSKFHVIPRIKLKKSKIIKTKLSISNEFTECKTELHDEEIEVKFRDLEPKDYIRISVIFESLTFEEDRLEYSFDYRLKEEKNTKVNLFFTSTEKFFTAQRDYDGIFYILTIGSGIFVLLMYLLVKYGLNINLSDPSKFAIGWKFIFYSPPAIMTLFFVVRWWKLITDFHYGYNDVKWHAVNTNTGRID
ncbi:MAG TPA: hypothetical protein PLN13_09335 [Bacteroidia bacterium]|nr:hypothetical protein [Bacteroidia bacterium]HRH08771.1 hypothetical protein [Bacteroidia bacterium]